MRTKQQRYYLDNLVKTLAYLKGILEISESLEILDKEL